MQSVGGDHLLMSLLPHEREQVDPYRAGAVRLVASDLVEAFDRARERGGIAQAPPPRRERPIRLRPRDDARGQRGRADPLLDRAEVAAVAGLRLSADHV